jgi:hypothetical protein
VRRPPRDCASIIGKHKSVPTVGAAQLLCVSNMNFGSETLLEQVDELLEGLENLSWPDKAETYQQALELLESFEADADDDEIEEKTTNITHNLIYAFLKCERYAEVCA